MKMLSTLSRAGAISRVRTARDYISRSGHANDHVLTWSATHGAQYTAGGKSVVQDLRLLHSSGNLKGLSRKTRRELAKIVKINETTHAVSILRSDTRVQEFLDVFALIQEDLRAKKD